LVAISLCHCRVRLAGAAMRTRRASPERTRDRMARPASMVFPRPTSSHSRKLAGQEAMSLLATMDWWGHGTMGVVSMPTNLPPGSLGPSLSTANLRSSMAEGGAASTGATLVPSISTGLFTPREISTRRCLTASGRLRTLKAGFPSSQSRSNSWTASMALSRSVSPRQSQ